MIAPLQDELITDAQKALVLAEKNLQRDRCRLQLRKIGQNLEEKEAKGEEQHAVEGKQSNLTFKSWTCSGEESRAAKSTAEERIVDEQEVKVEVKKTTEEHMPDFIQLEQNPAAEKKVQTEQIAAKETAKQKEEVLCMMSIMCMGRLYTLFGGPGCNAKVKEEKRKEKKAGIEH